MVRVGVPSLLPETLLAAFPPGVELVRIDATHTDTDAAAIEVDLLLAPWLAKDAARVLPRARGVKVVQAFTAGIEHLLPLLPAGAVLCDARGEHDAPTAEWAVMAILASLKYLPRYAGLQAEGRWNTREEAERHYAVTHQTDEVFNPPVMVEELHGKTVLIVGYGSIGKAIEARLAPFGVEILRIARTGRAGVSAVSELHALLPQAEVVVLITPLTPETRHLIDAAAIARMQPAALLVNASRGAVVDTDALVAALESRHIRAALDVTDPEPLPAGHPLWKAPGLLLTPHVAGSSISYLKRGVDLMRAQVRRYLAGEPLVNVVEGAY